MTDGSITCRKRRTQPQNDFLFGCMYVYLVISGLVLDKGVSLGSGCCNGYLSRALVIQFRRGSGASTPAIVIFTLFIQARVTETGYIVLRTKSKTEKVRLEGHNLNQGQAGQRCVHGLIKHSKHS